jgi:hypothetical protein
MMQSDHYRFWIDVQGFCALSAGMLKQTLFQLLCQENAGLHEMTDVLSGTVQLGRARVQTIVQTGAFPFFALAIQTVHHGTWVQNRGV